MSRCRFAVGFMLAGLAVQGCGSRDDTAMAVSVVPVKAQSGVRLIRAEALRGKDCPLLSAADVAAAVGIAASGIAANPAMACLYSWRGGRAVVSNIRVHRSVQRAVEEYYGATEDVTAAEMQAGIEALDDGLRAKVGSGEVSAHEASMAGALGRGIAGADIVNTDVDGIGDRASHDGTRIKVLAGNVVFDLAADTGKDFDVSLARALANRAVRNLEAL
jgi:carbon monoxide dehydrogenase subunit G